MNTSSRERPRLVAASGASCSLLALLACTACGNDAPPQASANPAATGIAGASNVGTAVPQAAPPPAPTTPAASMPVAMTPPAKQPMSPPPDAAQEPEAAPTAKGADPSRGCQAGAAKPGRTVEMLQSRGYVQYIPPGYDGKTPLPLVVDLHGAFQNGAGEENLSGIRPLADPNAFLYVAPDGRPGSGGSSTTSLIWEGVEDVDRLFIRDVVTQVGETACIDRSRVYATGCSNGGALAFLLACRDADMFAAIAPACAGSFVDLDTDCKPERPVPVMFVIGESDTSACWEGDYAPVILPPIMTPCARKVQSAFSKLYECSGMARQSHGGACETVDACQDGAEVVICKADTGHVVYSATNLDVADETWKFLQRFSK
jgi:poly(3-hydroxybutyrate) depolymerase